MQFHDRRVQRLRRNRSVGLLLAGALVLGACAGGGDGADTSDDGSAAADPDGGDGAADGADGDGAVAGLPPGAAQEEFVDALSDMSEVTFFTQTPCPEGTPLCEPFEEYFATVTDWSGGKIQFDIGWANSVVPLEETTEAIVDGRLDLVSQMVTYHPDRYPAINAIIDLSFLGSQTAVVGPMHVAAWMVDATLNVDEVRDEIESKGVKSLMPLWHTGQAALSCSEELTTLNDFEGSQARASTRVHDQQFAALGMSPVSLTAFEVFEGLQRGVIDCTSTSLMVSLLGGVFEAAPYTTIDPEAGMAIGTGSLVVNAGRMAELPLEAQQLIFDKAAEVFLPYSLRAVWDGYVLAMEQIEGFGGDVVPMDPEVREAVLQVNENIVDDMRGSDSLQDPELLVDYVTESVDKWEQILIEDLGYDNDVWYDELAVWLENEPDLTPFVDRFIAEVTMDHRPA